MRLHITADEWASVDADGALWLVRAGTACVDDGHPDGYECPADCPGAFPPARFAEAAKPCSMCRGTRKAYPEYLRGGTALDVVPGYDPRVPCPACRIDLVTECPTCAPLSEWCGYDATWRRYTNPGCDNGFVTLGSAYAATGVLPIVGDGEVADAYPYIEVVDGGEVYVWNEDDGLATWAFVVDDIAWEAHRGKWALKLEVAR